MTCTRPRSTGAIATRNRRVVQAKASPLTPRIRLISRRHQARRRAADRRTGTGRPRPSSAGRTSTLLSAPPEQSRRGGKTVSAHTLAALDAAASTGCVWMTMPGALMRRWSRGSTRITVTELAARNRVAGFPAMPARGQVVRGTSVPRPAPHVRGRPAPARPTCPR